MERNQIFNVNWGLSICSSNKMLNFYSVALVVRGADIKVVAGRWRTRLQGVLVFPTVDLRNVTCPKNLMK